MFEDGERRFVEFFDEAYCGIYVKEIVVAYLLAVELSEHLVEFSVESCSLMRVLTVA